MTPDRWQRVKEILANALELAPGLQPAYVAEACGGDTGLRAEVESLLVAHQQAGDALESPALENNASLIERRAATLIYGGSIGPYRLVELLGEGGMGSVYKAWQEEDEAHTPVAVKVVKPGLDSAEIQRRFRREREILQTLHHPNIARLLDSGTTSDGLPYFVMEFVEGCRIDSYCREHSLPVEARLRLFQAVCEAVGYAHRRQVLHRDIKPGNILVTPGGAPKLLDFGVGKALDPEVLSRPSGITETLHRMMTPEYASPEQLLGKPVTAASDIYSLGVLLYELLTGERPYKVSGFSPLALAAAICDHDPEPPSTNAPETETIAPRGTEPPLDRESAPLLRGLTPQLDDVVLKALRKLPAMRYATAEEFAADIGRYLAGRPTRARRGRFIYHTSRWLVRRGKLAAVAAVVLLSAVAIPGIAAWLRFSAPQRVMLAAPVEVLPFTTFPGNERQPVFSPDGTRIAFVWEGESGGKSAIWIRDLRGALRRLSQGENEDSSPAWSPDGRRIAFLRNWPDRSAVVMAPADGGEVVTVASLLQQPVGAAHRQLDWSPDGLGLVLPDRDSPDEPLSLYWVPIQGGQRLKLTSPPLKTAGDAGPAYSPDGQWLAFLRSPGAGVADVYVMRVKSDKVRRLTTDNRLVTSLAWTHSGNAIIFSSDRTGSTGLWTVPAGGGDPWRVPGTGDNASDPVFSTDGHKLAYTRSFRDANIWRTSLDAAGHSTGTPQLLIASTLYDSSPQPSPDGRRVAFRSNRSGANEVWTCNVSGEDCAQITRTAGPLTGSPSWSPDARWLAFDSRPQDRGDIFTVSAEGGYPRRLTDDPADDVVPHWSRDGRWIYFSSNRTGSWQVWRMPSEGGAAQPVTRRGGFAGVEDPGGRYVYYAKGRDVPGLWRVPVSGGKEEPVIPEFGAALWGYWAPARNGVYYLARTTPGETWAILLHRFTGAVPAPVLRLAAPPLLADSGIALSADGRTLYFTQEDQSGGDVMIASY